MLEKIYHILFINPSSQLGGAERSLISLAGQLDPKRFKVSVLLCSRGRLEEELKRSKIDYHLLLLPKIALRVGRSIHLKNLWNGFLSFFAQIPYWVRLLIFVKHQHFDLIHTNGVKSHLQGCLIKLILRKQLVWHVRDVFPAGIFIKLLVYLGGLFPEAILVNSQTTGIPFFKSSRTKKKVYVIYNGFDFTQLVSQPSRSTLERELNLSSDEKWIGHFGVFTPWKGQEIFLKAARIVFEQFPKAKFFLVGDEIYDTQDPKVPPGEYRKYLERKAEELEIASAVVFTGFQQNVYPFLNAMDLVVHSSTSPEPFGRILVEAMACEKPVIASGSGGVLEIITSSLTGRTFPMGDYSTLAKNILELLRDEQTSVQIGKQARSEVIHRFDLQSHVIKVQTLYEEILSRSR